MNDSQQPAASGARNEHAAILWLRQHAATSGHSAREFIVLLAVTTFLLLYGLVPVFGGDQLGLVGADEPRYAQIAREMLTAHSDACHEVNAKMVPRSLRLEDHPQLLPLHRRPAPSPPSSTANPGSKNPPSTTGAP